MMFSGLWLEPKRLLACHHLLWPPHHDTGRFPLHFRTKDWLAADGTSSIQLWLSGSISAGRPQLGYAGRVLHP